MDTSDLYTTVRNLQNFAVFIGYLGPHGMNVPANGEVTLFGNVRDRPKWKLRDQQALERDLLAGKIQILQTPRPILRDPSPAEVDAPTVAATVSVSSGDTVTALPSGTYYTGYTWTTKWGETLLGGISTVFTLVNSTSQPKITIPALPTDVVSANIYLSNVNGTNTNLRLYATGVTATTYEPLLATWSGTVTFTNATLPPVVSTADGPVNRAVKVTDDTLGTADPSWSAYRNV